LDLPSPTAYLAASSIYIKSRCVAQRRHPFFPTVSSLLEIRQQQNHRSADMSPCQLKTLHPRHSPLLHSRNWKDLPVSETGDESAWYIVLREPTEIWPSTGAGKDIASGLHCHHILSTIQSVFFRTLRAGDRKKMRNREGEVQPMPAHAPGPGPASSQKSRASLREYNALLEPGCLLSSRLFAEHACLLASCGAADQLSDA
jgi:hypothetical protein